MPELTKSIKTGLLAVSLCAVASGCTWVKKNPGADRVRIAPADLVGSCKSLGTVTSNTVNKVTVVNRSTKKVQSELETLARNEAAKSGADTIVVRSPIVDGQQTFELFRCL
ncbi:hypothetical protein GCM10008090_06440 [Arenicella chitinivorans]|uniref:DUF4156 domain-containing protein n=1 Tax=Arenicella chitinivorans TaxID=1329800 RepID=A0A918VI05_9GAMM|nr:DUF4156 domain-containing protein [Arenicella chitinivorans]GHA00398.1 hypothetical protein GCM10008090_06440 [Arenicella chitinivorans]